MLFDFKAVVLYGLLAGALALPAPPAPDGSLETRTSRKKLPACVSDELPPALPKANAPGGRNGGVSDKWLDFYRDQVRRRPCTPVKLNPTTDSTKGEGPAADPAASPERSTVSSPGQQQAPPPPPPPPQQQQQPTEVLEKRKKKSTGKKIGDFFKGVVNGAAKAVGTVAGGVVRGATGAAQTGASNAVSGWFKGLFGR